MIRVAFGTTDVFTGTIVAGDELIVGADGKLTKLVTPGHSPQKK
jgi:hypothetical protein